MTKSRVAASHVEWLSLVDTTGTFLTVPVVRRVFPAGLDPVPDELRAEVRRRLADEPVIDQASATVWLEWVLKELLGLTTEVLLEGPAVPDRAAHLVPEHGLLRPDYAVVDPDPGPDGRRLRMLIVRFPYGTRPDKPIPGDRWAATPLERAVALVRAGKAPLAMATDGDWFGVASSPQGGGSTTGTWASALLAEEPMLLSSFHALLSARRFFSADEPNTLAAMLTESVKAQEEVTNQLGDQVRQAVELLVGAFSRANRQRGGELLADVTAEEVYAAALTCMMRLVFLLYAEERDLLPARQELYATCYGVLGLRQALREEADRHGDETLERRSSAWQRLLATFRVVHGGVEHEQMRLPGYGGGLFDPDRYPFLEGRRPHEPWRRHESMPLPVDDRTMLAVLDALQVLTFRGAGIAEARPLSYRSLDVEQIGHVYEGLLDHGAALVDDPAVGLVGKGRDGPEVALKTLEVASRAGRQQLLKALVEITGRTEAQVQRDLDREPTTEDVGRLRSACEFDDVVAERVRPFLGLLVRDLGGLPTVYLPGSVYVTKTTERRDTGTQYTPKDLADEIVKYALEPLVYEPGPAETADATQWRLKAPEQILALRVCDPAVGSGAILVAACRYLSDRLVESVVAHGGGTQLPVALNPSDPDVVLVARRLVVDHCLYGVDRNPIAAEMAKLSLWLVTLARERPFTFLDHAIQVGDSLLGITSLDQVRSLHLDPERGKRLHNNLLRVTELIDPLVDEALGWITEMRNVMVVTVADAEEQRQLAAEAASSLEQVRIIADAIVGKALVAELDPSMTFDERLQALSAAIQRASDTRRTEAERVALWAELRDQSDFDLNRGAPVGDPPRRPMHWPLSFPEVLSQADGGFHAVVGNPPFLGGKRISTANGSDYREYLVDHVGAGKRGSADLVAYFFKRAAGVLQPLGRIGFFATNTIAQGDTREVGLDSLVESGWSIVRATKSRQWPGQANVAISQVWLSRRPAARPVLDGHEVQEITSALEPLSRARGLPRRLVASANIAFQGVIPLGNGFTLSWPEADELIALDSRSAIVVHPYLGGEDLVDSPTHRASRAIIDLDDRSEREARSFVAVWQKLERDVLPERSKKDAIRYPKMVHEWWKYWNSRPSMRATIRGCRRVIAIAATSKVVLPVFVPRESVFQNSLYVFAYDDDFHFGVLSSAFHWWWTAKYASTMRSDIRYTPTDVFGTFAQPPYSQEVEQAGQELDEYRRDLMIRRDEGLTKTYNRVSDPDEDSSDIVELRRLHVELDRAVADAYGWSDLELDHDFQSTRFGPRYTVGPQTQAEILDRLLELNHERYAAEQASAGPTKSKTGARRKGRVASPGQLSLTGRHG